MLDSVLGSATGVITIGEILLCTLASLGLGAVIAGVYMFRNSHYTNSFVVTVALLPAVVQAVILLVNGNLGTGIAVMGAFGLVRFRSAPGGAREITSIFFAMAVGLATGMGYLAYALLFAAIISAVMLLYAAIGLGERSGGTRTLRVTVPEDLDYTGLFDDLFRKYTRRAMLEKVKTTHLGSLFELQYTIVLKDAASEKELLDRIRQRNGNLTISCGRITAARDEL